MAVERIEIHERSPYLHGLIDVGPYELVRATAYFRVNPSALENTRIQDLALAADEDGLSRFAADLVLVHPQGAMTMPLLYVVANRGRASALPFDLDSGEGVVTSSTTIRAGDGFLLRRGYGVVWSGWQWDVRPGPNLVSLDPPFAMEGGDVPAGVAEMLIEVDVSTREHILIDSRTSPAGLRPLRATTQVDGEADLFSRADASTDWIPIDRREWRFAHSDGDAAAEGFDYVIYDAGFKPGLLYRLRYRPATCPVTGAGLLSSRDVVSMLRYDRETLGIPIAKIDQAIGFGVSQSGRYLRQFLFDGLNVDERGRQVFNGLLIDVAGPRRGDFNLRYGQMSVNRNVGPGIEPPFPTDDNGGGLLDLQRRLGHVPKIMLVNTASEYWRRNASLLHMTLGATSDLPLADDVRAYLIASASHVLGAPKTAGVKPRPANAPSVLNRWPALRALLDALHSWTRDEIAPPPSRIPSLEAGTTTSRDQALHTLSRLPGLSLPSADAVGATTSVEPRDDLNEQRAPLSLVAALDVDSNERCGVILPELAVPTATHLGFNTQVAAVGSPIQLIELIGTSHRFAATREIREATGDPRPSLDERYVDETDYVSRVRAAAKALVAERLLLEEDVEAVTDRALAHYRAATASG